MIGLDSLINKLEATASNSASEIRRMSSISKEDITKTDLTLRLIKNEVGRIKKDIAEEKKAEELKAEKLRTKKS